MDWRVKGLIQGVLSRLPGGTVINNELQRLVGGRRNEAAYVDTRVKDDWLIQYRVLRELGIQVRGRDMLEIGTGWLPVLPLCFSLAGVRRCYTLDLNRHLDWGAVPAALRRLERHLALIADVSDQDEAQVRSRWEQLMAAGDGDAVLAAAHIQYRAPADAADTGLEPASLVLVNSSNVLEHVAPHLLMPILRESGRLLQPDGVSLHSVNCGDHYAYFDRSITQAHYLRYSEKQWRWWNNDLHYQNRLRPVDFVDAAREAGLEIQVDLQVPRAELMANFASLPVAQEFKHYAAEQLCCTSLTFAARRHVQERRR